MQDEITQISETIRMLYVHDTDMTRKVKVTLTINKELRDLAEEFGINLSAFLEDRLFDRFRELILMKQQKNMVLRPGFEPGSPARKAGMIGRATPPELSLSELKLHINLVQLEFHNASKRFYVQTALLDL